MSQTPYMKNDTDVKTYCGLNLEAEGVTLGLIDDTRRVSLWTCFKPNDLRTLAKKMMHLADMVDRHYGRMS